jgi:outer membrane translocation and assembly module TamA
LGGGRTETTSARALIHTLDVNVYELNFNLYQPYIFNNSKINGNWELKTSVNSDIFRISTIDNTFEIGYELPRYTYVNNLIFDWKLKNERYTVINASTTDSLSNGSSTNIFYSVLGVSVFHNNSNDIQFPSHGNIQILTAEESGSLSNLIKKLFNTSTISYVKFTSLSKFYFNLGDFKSKSVLATKFLIGAIYEYGDKEIVFENQAYGINSVPLQYKYIAGGSTSVRGWAAKTLGTFDGKENGGNFLIEGTFEHRTRPFLDSKGIFKDLGFVSFFDYGNLWDTPKSFKFTDIALAIGFGVRYYTIVGPVRFDVGFKLYDYNPGIGIDKWLFNNSLNTIFTTQIAFQFGIGNTF